MNGDICQSLLKNRFVFNARVEFPQHINILFIWLTLKLTSEVSKPFAGLAVGLRLLPGLPSITTIIRRFVAGIFNIVFPFVYFRALFVAARHRPHPPSRGAAPGPVRWPPLSDSWIKSPTKEIYHHFWIRTFSLLVILFQSLKL